MERRSLLKLFGLLLSARGLSPRPLLAARPRRILVIGAGIAGLAAAHELMRAGHVVEVLEARARIGGRIHTSRLWKDAPMDLGASWIHGVNGNPLSELARSIGARTAATSYERNIVYGPSGAPLSTADERRIEQLQARIDRVISAAQEAKVDRSLQATVEAGLDWKSLSDADRALVEMLLNSTIEHEYAGSTRQLSTWWWDAADEFDGSDVLFPDGFGAIPEHLAQGLDIRLNEIVRRIVWDDAGVAVTTDRQTLRADQVVVSVPLGVLKAGAIEFAPRLPAAKRRAIDALGMGVLNKCFLRFPHAFWPTNVDWIERVPARRGEWAEWVSFQRAAGAPVLLGFNAADYGRQIESLSDGQIVADAMAVLRGLYGDIPAPLGQQITRWASDPFALGAYSFNALGSEPTMRDDLAASIDGHIHFAGEATHREHYATVHGALLSGRRVAREILLS